MVLTEQQQQQKQQAQELRNSLIMKCWEDETFKNELISNPIDTIEKFIGKPINLPKGQELVIVDQEDKQNVYLNIPAKPNLDNIELTDEQLEMVAGGLFPAILLYFSAGLAAGTILFG